MRSWAEFAGFVAPPGRGGRKAMFLGEYRAPTQAKPVPHPLEEGLDGIVRMIDACDKECHVTLIVLCGLLGLRVSEACSVRAMDVDFLRKRVLVRGKGDKERHVPISLRAEPYLKEACEAADSRVSPIVGMVESGARKAITRTAHEANLSRSVASHDLRATFATEVYNRTSDIVLVQELLGHSSVETTRIYIGVKTEALADAVNI